MEQKKKIICGLAMKTLFYIVLAVAVIWIIVWTVRGVRDAEIYIGSDNTINVTPERIAEIKQLGQWEFLTVVDEVVVDTIRYRRFMSDDRLTCIYHGTVRLGINLDHAPADWVTNRNDTIEVRLPAPSILDDNFIDEARTDVFYQNGRWGAYARELMYRRAADRMKAFAMSPQNIKTVKDAATVRFTSLFKSLGAKEVTVTFP